MLTVSDVEFRFLASSQFIQTLQHIQIAKLTNGQSSRRGKGPARKDRPSQCQETKSCNGASRTYSESGSTLPLQLHARVAARRAAMRCPTPCATQPIRQMQLYYMFVGWQQEVGDVIAYI
uniref:Uncharacterized protein n=1 Tax=Globodera rostochiensis TaxID=31243 RepID=A0A914GV82_GLORO